MNDLKKNNLSNPAQEIKQDGVLDCKFNKNDEYTILTSLSKEVKAIFVRILLIDSANNDFGFFVIIVKMFQKLKLEVMDIM